MRLRWFVTVAFTLSLISSLVRAQAPEGRLRTPELKPGPEVEQAPMKDAIRDFVGSMQARIEIERRIQAVQEMHQIILKRTEPANPLGGGAQATLLNQFPVRSEIPQEILGLPINYQTFSSSLADTGDSRTARTNDPLSILQVVSLETMLNGLYAQVHISDPENQKAHTTVFAQALIHMLRQGLPLEYAVNVAAQLAADSVSSQETKAQDSPASGPQESSSQQ